MMLDPISRNARNGLGTRGGSMWFSNGCTIGCSQCNDTGVPVGPNFPQERVGPSPNIGAYIGDECPNDHSKSKAPTIMDPQLLTMSAKWYKDHKVKPVHPWRAPGSTPGFDACGIAGGARTNMSFRAGGFGPETGYPQGFKGSALPPIPREQRKVWAAGETAEVSWVSVANHAGGYSYSLCPATEELTEECFERMPLQFVYNKSKLRYMFLESGLDTNGTLSPNHTEVIIPAHRVSEGVLPKGSMWSKNPIPAGQWALNGCNAGPATCGPQASSSPPQFEPPAGCDEHCWGYAPCQVGFVHPGNEGWIDDRHSTKLPNCSKASTDPDAPLVNGEGCCHTTAYMAIIDEVHVPQVPPGDYVVRWRWDCEQSPQIWSGCGDITIA